ncbi:MAG: alpha-ketoglutarate-dependent dioxygenase AlkB [Rhodospirillaceae bacterium]|nr:alpha-ketoglutarate-dependent dioxygenase AlkB [Rhodospirillaceae bacterium]
MVNVGIDVDAGDLPAGLVVLPAALDAGEQRALLDDVLALAAQAPFYRPTMPVSGAPFSVEMTNAGPLGWVSNRDGYRYAARHPVTGAPWPPIPERLLRLWAAVGGYPAPPECCLVNLYRGRARLGLHQDRDEAARDAPVVSVSLGDSALFRVGGRRRRDPTRAFVLESGAVVVLGGAARFCFHGVDRILSGTSGLVPGGGRINLTLRRVTPPDGDGRGGARAGG